MPTDHLGRDVSGAGVDSVDVARLPREALEAAAGHISFLSGSDISPEDYAEVAALFFEELAKAGLSLCRLGASALPSETEARFERQQNMPLAALKESYLRAMADRR